MVINGFLVKWIRKPIPFWSYVTPTYWIVATIHGLNRWQKIGHAWPGTLISFTFLLFVCFFYTITVLSMRCSTDSQWCQTLLIFKPSKIFNFFFKQALLTHNFFFLHVHKLYIKTKGFGFLHPVKNWKGSNFFFCQIS